jgi:hypothetical protein
MYRFESIDLGTYRGEDYFLVGFVEPDPGDCAEYDPDKVARNYGATIVRSGNSPREGNTQIVRMDTVHGRPHLDLVYLPPDAETRKRWLDRKYTYQRMREYLLANWRTFVDRYRRWNE